MGIPYTQHSFEDILLSREARRLGLPNMVGVIEYGMVARPYRSVLRLWCSNNYLLVFHCNG